MVKVAVIDRVYVRKVGTGQMGSRNARKGVKKTPSVTALAKALGRSKISAKSARGSRPRTAPKKKKHIIHDGGLSGFLYGKNQRFPSIYSDQAYNGTQYYLRNQFSITGSAGDHAAIMLSPEYSLFSDFAVQRNFAPNTIATISPCEAYTYPSTGTAQPLQGFGAVSAATPITMQNQIDLTATSSANGSYKMALEGMRIHIEQVATTLNCGFLATIVRLHDGGSFYSYDTTNATFQLSSPDNIEAVGLPNAVVHTCRKGVLDINLCGLSCNPPVYDNNHGTDAVVGPARRCGVDDGFSVGVTLNGTNADVNEPAVFNYAIIIKPFTATIAPVFRVSMHSQFFAKVHLPTVPSGITVSATSHRSANKVSKTSAKVAATQSKVRSDNVVKATEGKSPGVSTEDLVETGAAGAGGTYLASEGKSLFTTAEEGVTSAFEGGLRSLGNFGLSALEDAAPFLPIM